MERIVLCATIGEFAFWLKCEEKSKHTIQKYVRDVMVFTLFLSGQSVTKDLVLAFKQKLIDLGYAARSINSMLENINKSVDELVSLNIPYGESLSKYEQLSKYIIKANSIQAQISNHLKK